MFLAVVPSPRSHAGEAVMLADGPQAVGERTVIRDEVRRTRFTRRRFSSPRPPN